MAMIFPGMDPYLESPQLWPGIHAALIDDIAGRRFNRSDPDQSLMLLKPTQGAPHQGGLVFDQIPVPGRKPTNVAFGGPDNRTLVVTEVESASVYHARALVPGAPLWWQV